MALPVSRHLECARCFAESACFSNSPYFAPQLHVQRHRLIHAHVLPPSISFRQSFHTQLSPACHRFTSPALTDWSIHFVRKQFCCRASVDSATRLVNPDIQLEQETIGPVGQTVRAYPFPEIEQRWQQFWDANQTFRTPDDIDTTKPKFYVLDMFPYPSGAGLHVGHPEGYTATDIIARYKRMQGYNVLHPMGWDAFGLPAEQYAIETGTHPSLTTETNIIRFRKQLKSLGFSYDWHREISTTEPEYYKWTQWIFLQLFKRGLAYQAEVPVNWCPALGTVLANEEVIDGLSERGGHPVVRKPMRQWMLKITEYADRLLADLDGLDWPENVKDMQRNWIGRSEGAELDFPIVENDSGNLIGLRAYTTRPDTLCGATYLVIAPEHPLLLCLTNTSHRKEVESYIEAAARKSDLERTGLQKEKDGVFTGAYAINPATRETIPIWVADYVLGSYGTGAIMAVPAHDARDFDFAKRYKLPIRSVISQEGGIPWDGKEPYIGVGVLVNSCFQETNFDVNGLSSVKAAVKVVEWLEQKGYGRHKVNYKLRDWLFARQRYWGEPFPVLVLEGTGEVKAVDEKYLPIKLPDMDDFSPTSTGDPPLAKALNWIQTIDPETGKPARRESNTMPQWAGSCWYYLRFMDPGNSKLLVDTIKERYWGPVDLYVGGSEHSVLHLLYARFWHKVLYDIGVVSTKEPFQCLVNQGMILGEVEYSVYRDSLGNLVSMEDAEGRTDCRLEKVLENEVTKAEEAYVLKSDTNIRLSARAHKMSKSRGNVINPDDVVREYGADSLRLYEMFMGPLRDTKIWSPNGVEGVHRFLGRTWRLVVGLPISPGCHANGSVATEDEPSLDQLRVLHQCILKVTEEIEGMRFNTAISAMMEFVNAANKWDNRPKTVLKTFVLLLSPFAPHLAEELWQRLGHCQSLAYETWPKAIEEYVKEDVVTLAVQLNGKTRRTIQVPVGADEAVAVSAVLQDKYFDKYLADRRIAKKIYIPGRVLNLILSK